MRQSQHSGGQIIATSKEQELAANPIGVSDEFYRWKANVAGLDLSQATRLQALEDENAKLKKLLAEAVLILDNARLNSVAATDDDAQSVLSISRGQRLAKAATLRLVSSPPAEEA